MSTYYLAPNGSDGSDGTSSVAAWRTVSKAASVLTAGDTLLLQGGSTFMGPMLLAQPVCLSPYGPGRPVVQGGIRFINPMGDNLAMPQAVVRGLVLTGAAMSRTDWSGGWGLEFVGSWQNLLLEDVESYGNEAGGLSLSGSDGGQDVQGNILGPYSFLRPVLRSCYLHDNDGANDPNAGSGNGCGINVNGGLYGVIEGCVIANNGKKSNAGFALGTGYSIGLAVRGNTVDGQYGLQRATDEEGIQLDVRSFRHLVENNRVYNTSSCGISVWGGQDTQNHSDGSVIRNNVVVGACRDYPNDPDYGDINVSGNTAGNVVVGNACTRSGSKAFLTVAKGNMEHGNMVG